MVAKKVTKKQLFNEPELRSLIAKSLRVHVGGARATKGDIDDAMKYIKPKMREYVDTYAFSGHNPVDMAVKEYLKMEEKR